MNIEISQEVYDLVKSGELKIITTHLDASATHILMVERIYPTTVALKVANSRTEPLVYEVVGADRVTKGYEVRTVQFFYRLDKPAGRVIIGEQVKKTEDRRPETEEGPKDLAISPAHVPPLKKKKGKNTESEPQPEPEIVDLEPPRQDEEVPDQD